VDSLGGVELRRALAEALGVAVPPDLLELTPRALAALVGERPRVGEGPSPVVPLGRLRRGSLFLCAGGQGDSSAFVKLAEALQYTGLEIYGVDRIPGLTVGEMARDLAPRVARSAAQGPVILGGLSVGGW